MSCNEETLSFIFSIEREEVVPVKEFLERRDENKKEKMLAGSRLWGRELTKCLGVDVKWRRLCTGVCAILQLLVNANA